MHLGAKCIYVVMLFVLWGKVFFLPNIHINAPVSNELTAPDGKVLCESWVFLNSWGNVCALCMISAAFNVSLKQVDVSKDNNLKEKGLGER